MPKGQPCAGLSFCGSRHRHSPCAVAQFQRERSMGHIPPQCEPRCTSAEIRVFGGGVRKGAVWGVGIPEFAVKNSEHFDSTGMGVKKKNW